MSEVSISEMIAHTEKIHPVVFLKEGAWRDFLGDPAVKTLCFHHRRRMFDPWSGN